MSGPGRRVDDGEPAPRGLPLIGSKLGLAYVLIIGAILAFALTRDVHLGMPWDRLEVGMTPTEVMQRLGTPLRVEQRQGLLVHHWRDRDGTPITAEYRGGRLTRIARGPSARDSGTPGRATNGQ